MRRIALGVLGGQLGAFPARTQEAFLLQVFLEVAEPDDGQSSVFSQKLAQLLRGDALEIARAQIARHLLEGLEALADLLGGLVVGGLGAVEALAALLQELLELPQAIELGQELPEVVAGGTVLEGVVAKGLDGLRELSVLPMTSLQELVEPGRLEAVPVPQRRFLAIEHVVEPLAQGVVGLLHVVLLVEGVHLLAQIVEQLLDAHHPHLHAAELEARLAHPLERLFDVEPLHHQVRQRIERLAGVQGEVFLAAIPTAVAMDLHARAYCALPSVVVLFRRLERCSPSSTNSIAEARRGGESPPARRAAASRRPGISSSPTR
jgi:hypothetical protein